MQEMEAEHV